MSPPSDTAPEKPDGLEAAETAEPVETGDTAEHDLERARSAAKRGELAEELEADEEAALEREMEEPKKAKPKPKKRPESQVEKPKSFWGRVKSWFSRTFSPWVPAFIKRWWKGGHREVLQPVLIKGEAEERALRTALRDHPEYRAMMQKAGSEGGVPIPEEFFHATARIESNWNPNAKNKRAVGLFQFQERTWSAMPQKDLDRTDPEASIAAMAYLTRDNIRRSGIKPSDPDYIKNIYLLHHNGLTGWKRMKEYQEAIASGYTHAGFNVPDGYKYSKIKKKVMGVKVESYGDYVEAIDRLADRFVMLTGKYRKVLDEIDAER